MKLWGWWRKEDKKEEVKLLEDLKPEFQDNKPAPPKPPSLSQMISAIGVDDFKQLPQVPCFRNAMLTGMGIGFVASAVMFASKRQVSRSLNWAVGGFTIGSVIAWEQCRYSLYRSKRNVQKAKELYLKEKRAEEASQKK